MTSTSRPETRSRWTRSGRRAATASARPQRWLSRETRRTTPQTTTGLPARATRRPTPNVRPPSSPRHCPLRELGLTSKPPLLILSCRRRSPTHDRSLQGEGSIPPGRRPGKGDCGHLSAGGREPPRRSRGVRVGRRPVPERGRDSVRSAPSLLCAARAGSPGLTARGPPVSQNCKQLLQGGGRPRCDVGTVPEGSQAL